MQVGDVLVLGAGVVGLSTAWKLANAGARVTVLDSASSGGHGSRAAAGVGIPSVRLLDDPAMLELVSASTGVLLADLAALGLQRTSTGIIRPVFDPATRALLEAASLKRAEWVGRPCSRDELIALEPLLEGSPLQGGYVSELGGMVNTDAYVTGLAHAAAAAGAEIRMGEAALEVRDQPNRVEVRTAAGSLRADWLIVAAGAWSGGLGGLTPLPIRPLRGQMLRIFHPRARLQRILSSSTYVAPWRDGELVVGATEETAGFNPYPTVEGMLHLTAALARMMPALREARVVTSWAGLRASTPSGRPLIGAYPGTRRVLVASGHGGQGILTGGYTGQLVTEWVCTGRSAAAAPFSPDRALQSA
jgi:glycine oxidase